MTAQRTLQALAVASLLLSAPAAHAAGNPNVAHIDGYVIDDSHGCRILRDHEGRLYSVYDGDAPALRSGDHVRLEGALVPASRCRQGTGFELTQVQTVWGDDRHRTTLYDHLHDGSFRRFAERGGRHGG